MVCGNNKKCLQNCQLHIVKPAIKLFKLAVNKP
jgi:hypothetical protein